MEVQVETQAGLTRQLKISVPAEQVSKAVDAKLKTISKRAKIPGFRPGKAPQKVIQAQYGDQARYEALNDLIRDTWPEAIEKSGLNPAGSPEFEVTSAIDATEMEYTASFEVYPEIKLAPFNKLKVTKPETEVTDADVEKLIASLRKAKRTQVKADRPAKEGDVCKIDFTGKLDGEAFEGGAGKNTELEIGSGKFLPDLEKGVIGHSEGETFNVDVSFPKDYQAEKLAGKTAQFEVVLHSVKEAFDAEIDEDFLKAHNTDPEKGIEGLTQKCREALIKERDKAVRNKTKAQVMDQLLELNSIEVPEALVKQELPRLRQEAASRFNMTGLKPDQVDKMFPDEIFTEQATRRVSLGLLIGEVIKEKKIELDKDKLESTLDDVAADYEQPEQIKQFYRTRQDLLQGLRALTLEEQVVEALLADAKISTEKVSLDELLNPKEKAAA